MSNSCPAKGVQWKIMLRSSTSPRSCTKVSERTIIFRWHFSNQWPINFPVVSPHCFPSTVPWSLFPPTALHCESADTWSGRNSSSQGKVWIILSFSNQGLHHYYLKFYHDQGIWKPQVFFYPQNEDWCFLWNAAICWNTNCMQQSPSLKANWSSASQEIPRHFMKPKGSLPYSQEPATYPHLEPDQSTPCHPTYFLKITFNIILGLPSGLCPSGFPPKLCMHLSSPPIRIICPAHLSLLDFITWIIFLVRSTEHKAPCYVVSSIALLPRRS